MITLIATSNHEYLDLLGHEAKLVTAHDSFGNVAVKIKTLFGKIPTTKLTAYAIDPAIKSLGNFLLKTDKGLFEFNISSDEELERVDNNLDALQASFRSIEKIDYYLLDSGVRMYSFK